MKNVTLNQLMNYIKNKISSSNKDEEILCFGQCTGNFNNLKNPISIHLQNGNVLYVPLYAEELNKNTITVASKEECIKRIKAANSWCEDKPDDMCTYYLPDEIFGKTFDVIDRTDENDYVVVLESYNSEYKWCIPEIFVNN